MNHYGVIMAGGGGTRFLAAIKTKDTKAVTESFRQGLNGQ